MGNSSSVLGDEALSVIRLIDFEDFKKLKTFPRYPENKNIAKPLNTFDTQLYNNSLIIFISHCWLRGWNGAEGWDGRPHPDDAKGSKYELVVKGVELILKSMASEMKHCYIWLDYGCIDQDGDPAGELKLLDKIVQVCDCIYTPIHDPKSSSWSYPPMMNNFYEDYGATAWKGQPNSYLNRAWCRVEMFYAANIPLMDDDHGERLKKMSNGLAFHRKEGRRPHFLFGTKEVDNFLSPFCLPPLQNTWLERYHPEKGFLSYESNREVITRLVDELKPYMKKLEAGYIGERNNDGDKHGQGRLVEENGGVYEGSWEYGTRQGKGSQFYPNGDVYEGQFKNGRPHGRGKHTFSNGSYYAGDFENSCFHGYGIYPMANGDVYRGDWVNNVMEGKGIFTFEGHIYHGPFVASRYEGEGGRLYFPNSDVYEGAFSDSTMCGQGKMTYANGDIYIGTFVNDLRHGEGVLTRAEGTVITGKWVKDKYQE